MISSLPSNLSPQFLAKFILVLADDEFVLGHRDSEWTGYAPILEEDIAFSNIAQDELGHSLVWYTHYQELTGIDPDTMAFRRNWNEFTSCRFVEYPKGDFAYTVVRQYLFDACEQVKLNALKRGTVDLLAKTAERILKEEQYHLLHSKSLFDRLGNATPESSKRMQAALDQAFPQALGMFEPLEYENELIETGVFKGNKHMLDEWMQTVVPTITGVSLRIPVKNVGGLFVPICDPEFGGRTGNHTLDLKSLVDDLQQVHKMAPEGKW